MEAASKRLISLSRGNCTQIMGPSPSSRTRLLVEAEDLLPVALHADDHPALLAGLVVQALRERPDLAGPEPLGRAVGVLARGVVVQDEHRQPGAVAGLGVLQHLLVTGRVAKRGPGPAPDHQVDALGFAGLVVVQNQPRLLGQERLAALVVAVLGAAGSADHL